MIPGSGSDSFNFFAFSSAACLDFESFLGAAEVLKYLLTYWIGLKGCCWECELMIVSQMTASDMGGSREVALLEGYVAVIQTKSCFVFQLKSDVKSS